MTRRAAQRIAELEEGVATEADVRARFGEPEKIWNAADMATTPLPGAAAAAGARTFDTTASLRATSTT